MIDPLFEDDEFSLIDFGYLRIFIVDPILSTLLSKLGICFLIVV